ncbi:MAG: hypothetical protein AAF615_02300, partial [Pseudomonadota bacterium]
MVEMTDFYSVLQRAVSSLPDSSGPNRRAVYDKARKALLKQLQSFDPPLPSSDVTAQRLALEDAIRKIENEIARQIRTQRALQTAVPNGNQPRSRPEADGGADSASAAARAAEEERRARRAAEAERARRENAQLLQAAVSEATTQPPVEPEPTELRTAPVPVARRPEPQDVEYEEEPAGADLFEEEPRFEETDADDRAERDGGQDIV